MRVTDNANRLEEIDTLFATDLLSAGVESLWSTEKRQVELMEKVSGARIEQSSLDVESSNGI